MPGLFRLLDGWHMQRTHTTFSINRTILLGNRLQQAYLLQLARELLFGLGSAPFNFLNIHNILNTHRHTARSLKSSLINVIMYFNDFCVYFLSFFFFGAMLAHCLVMMCVHVHKS